GGGNDEFHVGRLQFGTAGVHDQLTVQTADPYFGYDLLNGNIGYGKSSRSGQTSQRVGHHLIVTGYERDQDLYLAQIIVREEGAKRAIDEAAGQYFIVVQPCFPF